jgi:ubiquinol-cytochrome c reductase iron-sulfur subunit
MASVHGQALDHPSSRAGEDDRIRRRDFLHIAAGAFAAVGAAMAAWPFVDEMNPDLAALAAGEPIDVDIRPLAAGQMIVLRWHAYPIFIVNRTPKNLQALQSAALLARLRDPDSAVLQQPSYAQNWHRSVDPAHLVLVGICTHLGCIPHYRPDFGAADLAPSWPGGFFCPCHGSKYDLSGRVFQGVPAPYNLPVPPYRFISETILRLGENPPGQSFEVGDVEQI